MTTEGDTQERILIRVETQVEEHGKAIDRLHDDVQQVRTEVQQLRTEMNAGFQHVNQRIDQISQRMDRLSQRIDQLMPVGLTAAIGIIIAAIIVPLLRGG